MRNDDSVFCLWHQMQKKNKNWYLKVQYILFYLYQHSGVLKKAKRQENVKLAHTIATSP